MAHSSRACYNNWSNRLFLSFVNFKRQANIARTHTSHWPIASAPCSVCFVPLPLFSFVRHVVCVKRKKCARATCLGTKSIILLGNWDGYRWSVAVIMLSVRKQEKRARESPPSISHPTAGIVLQSGLHVVDRIGLKMKCMPHVIHITHRVRCHYFESTPTNEFSPKF